MNKPTHESSWMRYEQIPDRKRSPVKLEDIVAARIEAFMRAKKVKADRRKAK